jgi:NTP pyrophosphatase (non-canonical NTP hydrolase)
VITVAGLQQTNADRAKRWHKQGIEDWSVFEWAGAMAGEAGEACNAAKKLKRVETEIQHHDTRWVEPGDQQAQLTHYRHQVALEAADTIMYAILLIERVGHDAEAVLREVFNKKSEEYGFPERL